MSYIQAVPGMNTNNTGLNNTNKQKRQQRVLRLDKRRDCRDDATKFAYLIDQKKVLHALHVLFFFLNSVHFF